MKSNKKGTILIIEDDADIRSSVRLLLESDNYVVEEAASGEEGLEKISLDTNLVILDVMMPGKSGYDVCEELRREYYMPVLFLTAKAEESDKMRGLNAGADDYLTKPFSFAELSARVSALLRRHQVYSQRALLAESENDLVEQNGIQIHTSTQSVMVHGQPVSLTEKEYQILLFLMRHPGKIFTLCNLYQGVWNEPFFNASANTVMVHVRNLRRKIEKDPENPEFIQTIWGKGYRFG